MTVFVAEAHDFVFDGRAIARPLAVYESSIDRGEMEVVLDQLMGGLGGAGDVAGHLLAAHPGGGKEGIGPSQYGIKSILGDKFADIEEKYDLSAIGEGFSDEGEDEVDKDDEFGSEEAGGEEENNF